MSMNIRFDNKVAVVTGGTAGIGLACAQLFGQLGAKVAICGTNPTKLAAALEELKAERDVENVVMLMPGSHTHGIYIQGDQITGIISNFTGELFYALKQDTILSPVLTSDSLELDEEESEDEE